MKETMTEILSSPILWIVLAELLAIAILVFFIMKNSRRKKTIKEDIAHNLRVSQYRELDEMLVNTKRGKR